MPWWPFESPHDKTNKMMCAQQTLRPAWASTQSDQSLWRPHGSLVSYPLSIQRRLIRLGGCPSWSESSMGAHAFLLVLSWGASFAFSCTWEWSNKRLGICWIINVWVLQSLHSRLFLSLGNGIHITQSNIQMKHATPLKYITYHKTKLSCNSQHLNILNLKKKWP